jgi:hypothetical protein
MPQTASAIAHDFIDFNPDGSPNFGDLCLTEKCQLLSLLAIWQQQITDDQPYDLEDAVTDSMFEVTAEVQSWIDYLKDIGASHATARRFMWGLAEDIKDTNEA